jgi:hypothetical protein
MFARNLFGGFVARRRSKVRGTPEVPSFWTPKSIIFRQNSLKISLFF